MHKVVVRKLDKFRLKFEDQFKVVFDVIRQLTASQAPGRKRVGFEVPE